MMYPLTEIDDLQFKKAVFLFANVSNFTWNSLKGSFQGVKGKDGMGGIYGTMMFQQG